MTTDFRIERAQVERLGDADLAWAAVEPLWDAVDLSDGWTEVSQVMARATRGQRALLAVDWCQKEVRNGGLVQFFQNSTGMLAREARDGFQQIGADGLARVLTEALALSPALASRSRVVRVAALTALFWLRWKLNRLDDKFLNLVANDALEPVRAAFVRAHPEEFFRDASA